MPILQSGLRRSVNQQFGISPTFSWQNKTRHMQDRIPRRWIETLFALSQWHQAMALRGYPSWSSDPANV
jgi:hypothetical protein